MAAANTDRRGRCGPGDAGSGALLDRRLPARVIAITGSVGKTSTKELTHAVLSQRYETFKTPGNRNSVLGLPPALFELSPAMSVPSSRWAMFTRGEIARLAEITRPSVGVVTMIDPVHMERAGSLENIVAAKQELVEALPSDGTAILNYDEPLVMGMAAHTRADVFTYGLDPAPTCGRTRSNRWD
jgi:UDP-N-acetylmuramoyl-tripeptide--D-alanyl-D-alanine ligase